MTPRRPRTAAIWPTALLCAAALLAGGCDGGLFGTGEGSADADAGPIVPGVAGGDLQTDGDGTASGGGAPDAVDAADELEEVDQEGAGVETFSNTLATHAGEAPLVRGVNLTGSPVRLEFGGAAAGADLPVGSVGDAIALPLGITDVQAVDAFTDERLALQPVSLGASTLTTVLLLQNDDGIALVPLETRVRTDGPDVALVRAIDATGAAATGPLELRPQGGGTVLSVPAPSDGTIAGGYVSALPGDYTLVFDGSSTPVGLVGGRTVSLVLTSPMGGGTSGGTGALVVIDSDIDSDID